MFNVQVVLPLLFKINNNYENIGIIGNNTYLCKVTQKLTLVNWHDKQSEYVNIVVLGLFF